MQNRTYQVLLFLATLLSPVASVSVSAQDLARAIYARAEALVQAHDWDAGLAELGPLLEGGARAPKVFNLAGLACMGKGDPKQAESYFKAALEIDASFVPALKNLAIEEIGTGQVEAAERHFAAAYGVAPSDAVVNLYLGEIAYGRQDFKGAVGHLRQAEGLIGRDPNLVAALAVSELKIGEKERGAGRLTGLAPEKLASGSKLALGLALAGGDMCAEAVPYLAASALGTGHSGDIRYDLAICEVALKAYPEAIAALIKAGDEGYESSESDNLLAEAYEGNHETQAAVDALRRAIALNPNEDNYLDFASLCIDHQDFGNAAKVLEVGLAAHPKSSRLVFERAILDAMQDRFDQAEKDFQLSAELAPESDSGYIGLGVTYLETGKSAQAVPVLEKRVREHPSDASLSYLLGEALLRAGAREGQPEYAEARKRLEAAVRLEPKMVEAHVSLGTMYLGEGKFQQSVEELEAARRLDPDSRAADSHLAVAYRRLGKPEKAKEVLLELKEINDRARAGTRDMGRAKDVAEPVAAP